MIKWHIHLHDDVLYRSLFVKKHTVRNTSSNKNMLQSVMQTVVNGLNTVYGVEINNKHANERRDKTREC